jgi:hypothetical protein
MLWGKRDAEKGLFSMVEVLFLQESKKKDAKGSDSLCNN